MVRRPTSLAFLVMLMAFGAGGRSLAAQELTEVRRIEQSYEPSAVQAVRLDLSFGDVVVKGAERDDIGVEIVFSCPSGRDQATCRQRAERLLLEARNRSKHLGLRLRRTPRARIHGIRADMTVLVPKSHDVEVDVRAGSVEVSGVEGNVEVDIGSGDTTIWYPQALVAYVKADVGAGSANLWLADDSLIEGTGWPRSFTWRSSGNGQIEVDTGTGAIAIRLLKP